MLQNPFQEISAPVGLLVQKGEGKGEKKLQETSLTIKILLVTISHTITGGRNYSGEAVKHHGTVALQSCPAHLMPLQVFGKK